MPTINESPGLLFSFAEMEKEITNLTEVASAYLEEAAEHIVVKPWLQQLRNFKTRPIGSRYVWKIPLSDPLKTRPSTGDYEPSGHGAHTVVAELSSIWDIEIPQIPGVTPRRGRSHQYFSVYGKASTRISIKTSGGDELARWRFEIGDAAAPGCHFHTQVLGEEEDDVFPHSMSVPRLPNMLFTPMDSLDFVLAELFQKDWPPHVSRDIGAVNNWASCQKKRLSNLLKWQQDRLEKNSGSPWTALKASKPSAEMLIGAN